MCLPGVIPAARALPPRLPSSAAADLAESSSSGSSPVAIRMTSTAAPITSAGRFSPRGPRGISASVAAGAVARRAVDRRFDLCDNLVSRHSPEAALVSFAEILGHAISAVRAVLIVRVDVVIPALAAFYDCAGLLQ